MEKLKDEEILTELKNKFGDEVKDYLPFPKPYPDNIKSPKAILLGCDPTNTSYNFRFEYVFALGTDKDLNGKDITKFKEKFLPNFITSLKSVDLTFETIYTQNLCQNYFEKETSKNLKIWNQAAKIWIPYLKQELSVFNKDIPVLLTSKYLYDVLIIGKKHKPINYYKLNQSIPINRNENLLERPLIPFYRNRRKIDYHLSNPEWEPYKQKIIEILNV
jgi:hypothetical protein